MDMTVYIVAHRLFK